MSPDKRKTIKGHKIEQYYWSGKDVVYVDNKLTDKKYDNITVDNVDEIHKALIRDNGRKCATKI